MASELVYDYLDLTDESAPPSPAISCKNSKKGVAPSCTNNQPTSNGQYDQLLIKRESVYFELEAPELRKQLKVVKKKNTGNVLVRD